MGFLWWRFLCLQTSTLMQRKSFILVLVYLCITELLACSRWLKRLKLLSLNQGIIPFFFSPIKFTENVRLKEIWDKGTSRKIKSNRKKECNHVISSYANFLEQRTFLHFTVFNPNISIHNMVAVPLFWETNMAALTSCEDELWHQLKIQEYSLLALIMLPPPG